MLISDRITGLALIALGGAAYYGGSLLPPVPGQQVGPNVFPMVVGGGLAACGALIALRVGATLEEEAEADLAAHSDAPAPVAPSPAWLKAFQTLLPPLLLMFYVLVVDRIGFILTAFTIILLTSFAMGARWKLALPLALIAPFGVHLIFYKLLRVPLPVGLVPLPW